MIGNLIGKLVTLVIFAIIALLIGNLCGVVKIDWSPNNPSTAVNVFEQSVDASKADTYAAPTSVGMEDDTSEKRVLGYNLRTSNVINLPGSGLKTDRKVVGDSVE